jgi:site-specific DNA-methyltransferase (adenine-specific)
MRIELGDCLEVLKTIPDNSVSSVVTDPPYGLSFMNKQWDYDVPSVEIWKECLRVLKPGGHLLAFSGSRTYHRMAVRIEDAGFEIRDQIMWVYGSGFPKSHNIGKAVDKLLGNDREVVEHRDGTQHLKTVNSNDGWKRPIDEERILNGYNITKGTSEWEGWGTALKPSHEPIVMARKPLSEKTVALNVLRWGTGGINIDDSRVDNSDMKIPHNANELQTDKPKHHAGAMTGTIGKIQVHNSEGRFPANIIFDEEAGQVLDQQSGFSKTNCKSGIVEGKEANIFNDGLNKTTGHKKKMIVGNYKDEGGASRFFYCPKASKKDRDEGLDVFDDKERYTSIGQRDGTSFRDNGTQILPAICKNNHPTVKPTALMEYLIKLVTPKGGTVMDCFLGSGSTGKAAVRNGFDFIGIERDEEYIKIAEARIKNELNG